MSLHDLGSMPFFYLVNIGIPAHWNQSDLLNGIKVLLIALGVTGASEAKVRSAHLSMY